MDKTPYSLPEIYDIAFTFRDYYKAVDFLQEAASRVSLREVKSTVELGAGPAQYAREFARRGVTAFAVDRLPEMNEYARELCARESLTVKFVEEDMRSFRLPQKVDLAICMMATFHCLLTNDDIVQHLNAVADNLVKDGLYIIEMNHPRYAFNTGSSTQNKWEMERGGIKVQPDWGSDAEFDPLTEIDSGTVIFAVTQDGNTEEHSFTEQWRDITSGLMQALIELSGKFKIAATYGDLSLDIPFDNAKKAWRMVLVLRKC